MDPLVVEGLSIDFGGLRAVSDVSLAIGSGERRALIGPNGAGKTTLFNLVSGQLAPTAGRILLFGKDVTRMPPFRRAALGLARTFQITNLLPNLTVLDNVLLALAGLDRAKFSLLRPLHAHHRLMSRAQVLLEQVGLTYLQGLPARALSYGDQRELEILMALAGSPKLLLLDEPTAGLSPAETQVVVDLIRGLDPSITILLIEHDLDVAFQVASHVTVLHLGEIIAQGSPEQIKADPRVIEIYLGVEQAAIGDT